MDAEHNATYTSGEFFISPVSKFSVIGLAQSDEEGGVNDNGYNYSVISDIFETEIDTMRLSLYYNTQDSKDRFNNINGKWRSSYNSYLDFKVDYENANVKSLLYDTARNACEQGFNDVKETLYRGILSAATTVYDTSNDLCIIRQEGNDIGRFNVWNRTDGIVGDYHYLTKQNGQTLVFSKESDNRYFADDKGIKVELVPLEAGKFEYIDAMSRVYTYSAEGNLEKIMYEGKETLLSYDDHKKITRVDGPLGLVMSYNYADNETLESIVYGDKSVLFQYDEDNHLASIDIETKNIPSIEVDENGTPVDNNATDNNVSESDMIETSRERFASFTYNQDALLISVTKPAVTEQGENNTTVTISEGGTETYTYDDEGRVASIVNSKGETTTYTYLPESVTRAFSSGKSLVENITFSGSKQQVKRIDDGASSTDAEYNQDAQAIKVEVLSVPTPVIDENGSIVAQSLGGANSLSLSFAYNERGLVNKIQYSSVDSGNRFTELEYKSRYPKPTKVLTNDAVTFFDYNQKGQLIRKTSLTFDKEMKLKSNSVTFDSILSSQERSDKLYAYDGEGFLVKVTDSVEGTSRSYSTNPDGSVSTEKIKPQNFWSAWLSQYIAWLTNSKKEGWTLTTGGISAADENTKVYFVGGAGDDSSKIVKNFSDIFKVQLERAGKSTSRVAYAEWNKIDTIAGNEKTGDPFEKDKEKLIVVGHSWGGDSSVEASKQTDAGKGVDLLVTVDPVGIMDYNDGAKYWVEIYADAGYPFGGYYAWVKKSKVIASGRRPGRCGWRPCWKSFTVRVYWWSLDKTETMAWNNGDWIAWTGGKGWYSSYDPGDGHPDKLIRIAAHHEQFEYMLWKMERGIANEPNNRFDITNPDRDADEDLSNLMEHRSRIIQTSNSRYPQVFSTNLFWK